MKKVTIDNITVTIAKKNNEEARAYFARVGADLSQHFTSLGSRCIELTANVYTDKTFYKEHKTIKFDTLSSFGEYEVVAVFKFNTNKETFKY